MIGAMATGAMKSIACQENDMCASLGMANHEASATGEKSIAPLKKMTDTIYPATAPKTTGMSFTIPLPQMEAATATASDTKARIQLDFAMFTPELASERPMRTITGPMTIGGKSFLMNPIPNVLTSKLIRT